MNKAIRLDEDVYYLITECAQKENRSRTQFVNKYLRESLTPIDSWLPELEPADPTQSASVSPEGTA